MAKNVSDQIVEFLIDIGVKHIYGIPGDTVDSIMESLRKQNKIRFVVCRHEEAAAFAASFQAKLTGELAVCVACQGPGAIHLLNGLYDAATDRAPVLAITGQVPNAVIGTDMPQEINQIALFQDCCVYNQEMRDPAQTIPVFTSAFQAAMDKPGVAHISIPSDVMRMPANAAKFNPILLKARSIHTPHPDAIAEAVKVIAESQKIAILYGHGSRDAAVEIMQLSEKLKAPLTHTTRSKDLIDNHHPHYMGGIGLMGSHAGNYAVHNAEVLIVIGSSFAYHEYYPDHAKIIQIDVDPNRLAKHCQIACGIIGDAKLTASALLSQLPLKTDSHYLIKCKSSRANTDKLENWQTRPDKPGELIHPQALTQKLNEHLPTDAVIIADAGGVTVWGNNFLKLNGKQRWTWSANLASLGACLPGAIAAKLTYPDRPVIGLAGDGGFGMLLGDFATAVRYQLPILYIVYNNFCYGFIELEEQGEGNPVFGTKLNNPDFAELAKVFGGDGIVVKNFAEIDAAIQRGLASKVPFIMDVHTDPKALMIPPVINAKMAYEFGRSHIRTWFAKPSEADK